MVLGGVGVCVPLNALAGWRPERQGRSELSLYRLTGKLALEA